MFSNYTKEKICFRSTVALAAIGMSALASLANADMGRVPGAAAVSPTGAMTYSIPLWTPPGPKGMQPPLTFTYSSDSGNGTMGVGWSLAGMSSIERCNHTLEEDDRSGPVMFATTDRFCIDGNKMRIVGAPLSEYGTPGKVYQTQIANFSRITSSTSLIGTGPESFVVHTKDNLILEYGTTADSRVQEGGYGGVLRWMLRKVSDRDGNSYVIEYTGIIPASMSWAPIEAGADQYQYKATFVYSFKVSTNDFVSASPNGVELRTTERLDAVTIGYSASGSGHETQRQYRLGYELSPTTLMSRLIEIKDCGATDQECLQPTTVVYQDGVAGFVPDTSTPVPAHNGAIVERTDFNGDGRSDLAYYNGSTWRVAFSTGSGFSAGVDTTITGSAVPLVGRFVSSRKDGFLATRNGSLHYFGFNGVSFTATIMNFQLPITSLAMITDQDGDGIEDIIWTDTVNRIGYIYLRRNTTTGNATVPSFGGVTTAYNTWDLGLGGGSIAIFPASKCPLERSCDLNGDGAADLQVVIVTTSGCGGQSGCTATTRGYDLYGGPLGYAIANEVLGTPNVYLGMRFNDDRCTDSIRFETTTLRISNCGRATVSTASIPIKPRAVADWDGDKNTDVIVNAGGELGVYRSRGSAASPFDPLLMTSIPFDASCSYLAIDVDGDTLDDLACFKGASIQYWTHAGGGSAGSAGGAGVYATQISDLLSIITDGYGMAVSAAYVSTAQSSYTPPESTELPLVEDVNARIVVGRLTTSDGVGGAYDLTYEYAGARRNGALDPNAPPGDLTDAEAVYGPNGLFVGYETVSVVDSRTNLKKRTTYEQAFPLNGRVKQVDLFQSNHSTLISSTVMLNDKSILSNETGNRRFFTHVVTETTVSNEVSANPAVNGLPNSQVVKTFTYANPTYGNLSQLDVVGTDFDARPEIGGASGETWSTSVVNGYAPAVDSGTDWCVGLLTATTVTRSSSRPGVRPVTRKVAFTKDEDSASKCRVRGKIIEPDSLTYRATESYLFDAFGNIRRIGVTGLRPPASGIGAYEPMGERVTTIYWGETGQFPLVVTDPTGAQDRRDFYPETGRLHHVESPNNPENGPLEMEFQYDAFGRPTRQKRLDGTITTWEYIDCQESGCMYDNHRLTVLERSFGIGEGVQISDAFSFVDAAGRTFATAARRLTADDWDNSYHLSENEFDAQGRSVRTYVPCIATNFQTSCKGAFTQRQFDVLGRVTRIAGPMVAGQSPITTITYDRRQRTVTDAKGRANSTVNNFDGTLRRTTDANGFSINHTYDAAGSLLGTTAGTSPSLQPLLSNVTVHYGVAAFTVDSTDASLGRSQNTFNSLGELESGLDGNLQRFSMTYDSLSRPTNWYARGPTGGPTGDTVLASRHWVWGDSRAAHNVGQIVESTSIEGGEETTETRFYDSFGRVARTQFSLPGEPEYSYVNEYDAASGFLSSLEYPATVNGEAVKLAYNYQHGRLHDVVDGHALGTTFWSIGGTNGRGQLTVERLGNPGAPDIVVSRDFNPINGRLNNIRAGTPSNTTSLQALDYQYDEVGNVIQRQNGKQTLTEDFRYDTLSTDQLYRLRRVTLNDAVNPSSDTLELDYNALGSIISRTQPVDAPAADQAISWTPYNYPRQITTTIEGATEIATFSYGPSNKRWKMTFSSGGVSETTLYIGGLLEKVSISGQPTRYRHTLMGGKGAFAILERVSGSADVVRYVLVDNQGGIDTIATSSGALIANESFSVLGERRDATDWRGPPTDRAALDAITRQGYTYQTVLGSMGLNHMNGRVQDALTGQLLSADPTIPHPSFTQAYNRYAYVYNNPATLVDPSGLTPGYADCWRVRDGSTEATEIELSEQYPAGIIVVVSVPTYRTECVFDDPAAPLVNPEDLYNEEFDFDFNYSTGMKAFPDAERKPCTAWDNFSDAANRFIESTLYAHVFQLDFEVELVWGENEFDRWSLALGRNTLGQFVLTQEIGDDLGGEGFIISGNMGLAISHSRGPAESNHDPAVHHRQVIGSMYTFGASGSVTESSNSVEGSLPEPKIRSRGGLSRAMGYGVAIVHGTQEQYTGATPPLIPKPQYSGCAP